MFNQQNLVDSLGFIDIYPELQTCQVNLYAVEYKKNIHIQH